LPIRALALVIAAGVLWPERSQALCIDCPKTSECVVSSGNPGITWVPGQNGAPGCDIDTRTGAIKRAFADHRNRMLSGVVAAGGCSPFASVYCMEGRGWNLDAYCSFPTISGGDTADHLDVDFEVQLRPWNGNYTYLTNGDLWNGINSGERSEPGTIGIETELIYMYPTIESYWWRNNNPRTQNTWTVARFFQPSFMPATNESWGTCTVDSDCFVNGAVNHEVQCVSGRCHQSLGIPFRGDQLALVGQIQFDCNHAIQLPNGPESMRTEVHPATAMAWFHPTPGCNSPHCHACSVDSDCEMNGSTSYRCFQGFCRPEPCHSDNDCSSGTGYVCDQNWQPMNTDPYDSSTSNGTCVSRNDGIVWVHALSHRPYSEDYDEFHAGVTLMDSLNPDGSLAQGNGLYTSFVVGTPRSNQHLYIGPIQTDFVINGSLWTNSPFLPPTGAWGMRFDRSVSSRYSAHAHWGRNQTALPIDPNDVAVETAGFYGTYFDIVRRDVGGGRHTLAVYATSDNFPNRMPYQVTAHYRVCYPDCDSYGNKRNSCPAACPNPNVVVSTEGVSLGCSSHDQCDDGNWCNGVEHCVDINGVFTCTRNWSSVPQVYATTGTVCPPAQTCVNYGTLPATGVCQTTACSSNDDCDNKVWCDGQETCVGGVCVAGAPPCGTEPHGGGYNDCNEREFRCPDTNNFNVFCPGGEFIQGTCQAGPVISRAYNFLSSPVTYGPFGGYRFFNELLSAPASTGLKGGYTFDWTTRGTGSVLTGWTVDHQSPQSNVGSPQNAALTGAAALVADGPFINLEYGDVSAAYDWRALSFNATSGDAAYSANAGVLDSPHTLALDSVLNTMSMTLSAYVYWTPPAGDANWRTVARGDHRFQLQVKSDTGAIQFGVWNNGSFMPVATAGGALRPNEWHRIRVVYHGITYLTDAPHTNIYVDERNVFGSLGQYANIPPADGLRDLLISDSNPSATWYGKVTGLWVGLNQELYPSASDIRLVAALNMDGGPDGVDPPYYPRAKLLTAGTEVSPPYAKAPSVDFYDYNYSPPSVSQVSNPSNPTQTYSAKVLQMDARNQMVSNEALNNSALARLTQISYEAWVYRQPLSTNGPEYVVTNSGGSNVAMWIDPVTQYANCAFADAVIGTSHSVASTSKIYAMSWYHLLCSFDGLTMKIWVNGANEASANLTGATGFYIPDTLGGVSIGADSGNFVGYVTGVKFWDRAKAPDVKPHPNPQCGIGSDCPPGPSFCQSAATCSNGVCGYNSPCSGSTPTCDADASRCVQCLLDGDCTTGYACDTSVGTCKTSCASNADCQNGLLCATDTGTCTPLVTEPEAPSATGATGRVTLRWQPSNFAASYSVLRGTAHGGPYTTISSAAASPYLDETVSNGSAYYYVIRGVNAVSTADSEEVSVTPLAAPSGVTGPGGPTCGVQISWTAVAGATGYNVLRGTIAGTYTQTFTVGNSTNYVDSPSANGSTLYYVVQATNPSATSANSAEVSAQVMCAPGTVTGRTGASKQAIISWSIVSGANSYALLRSTSSGGPYATISSAATAPYLDSGLTNGTTYYYVVTATGGGIVSPYSNEVAVRPLGEHYIFVTSGAVRANMNGDFGSPDRICQAAADAGSVTRPLNRTWVAFIAQGGSNPSNRPNWDGSLPLKNMAGQTLVSAISASSFPTTLAYAIGYTENGASLSAGAWTGSTVSGTAAADSCGNWTNTSLFLYGYAGFSATTANVWPSYADVSCSNVSMHLLCVSNK
jgi:hypothetical protein